MKRTFPHPLIRPQPQAKLSALFRVTTPPIVTPAAVKVEPLKAPESAPPSVKLAKRTVTDLDSITIHITDNTESGLPGHTIIKDRHPLRRIYSQADMTPRKERLARESAEVRSAIKSVAISLAGAIVLAAGVIAGFFLSSISL